MQPRMKSAAASVILAVALLAVLTGLLNQRSDIFNREKIQTLLAGRDLDPVILARAPLPVLMARALFLARKQRYDEARDLLNYLSERGDDKFRSNALYNLGNTIMRMAYVKIEADDVDQAIPLVALAKQAYRRALELEPGYWDAKYNFEAATRVAPEIDRIDNEGEDDEEDAQSKRLWTTLPGFPRGQP